MTTDDLATAALAKLVDVGPHAALRLAYAVEADRKACDRALRLLKRRGFVEARGAVWHATDDGRSRHAGTRELSMDARVILSSVFAFGDKTTVRVGGVGAQSILSPRGQAAVDELVAAGLLTAKEFNRFGRMEYQGTLACRDVKRLPIAAMEEHGAWSWTMPNPAFKGEEAQAQ